MSYTEPETDSDSYEEKKLKKPKRVVQVMPIWNWQNLHNLYLEPHRKLHTI